MVQNLEDIQRISVSPDLIEAYIIELGKALLVIVSVAGAYFLVKHLAGEDPFASLLDTAGIPFVWIVRGFIGLSCLLLLGVFFNTLSLTSYELVFEGDSLTYSYGSFLKVTKSTRISNIIRVNFTEHKPLRIGDIVIDLSGTEEKAMTVQYVRDVKAKSELINRLMGFKKAQDAAEIDEKGALQ